MEISVIKRDEPVGNSQKLKLLIAEDDYISSRMLAKRIEIFSSEIIFAENGAVAVEMIRNNPDIDLIFMDLGMPQMDGFEAIKKIREFNNKVIIIVQSAYGFNADKERASVCGCTDFIMKPIQKDQIFNTMRKYFNI